MSLDGPILSEIDLTHLDILEPVKPFRDVNINTVETTPPASLTEALKMSKTNSNDLTTGLADLIKEIKGDHAKLGSGLKDILKEYHLEMPKNEDEAEYSEDLAMMVDGFLSGLKERHSDLFEEVTTKLKEEHFAESYRSESKRPMLKNDFATFVQELDAKLFSFDGYNEYVEPFFVDIDEDTCELWNFVPVLAYVCWDAWQNEELVDLNKMLEVIPANKNIGPSELFAFIQVADVVYTEYRRYSQK